MYTHMYMQDFLNPYELSGKRVCPSTIMHARELCVRAYVKVKVDADADVDVDTNVHVDVL